MNNNRQSLSELSNEVANALQVRAERTEYIQFGIRLVLILAGAAVAGAGGLLPEPKAGEFPWRPVLGFGGLLCVFVGGALTAFLERGNSTDLENARKAVSVAEAFMVQQADLQSRLAAARDLDTRRRHLISGQKLMLETAETLYGRPDGVAGKQAVENLIDGAKRNLLAAMNVSADEEYNFSIFRVQALEGQEQLVRLVNRCADRADEERESRTWTKGRGFSGTAWKTAGEVIIEDTSVDGLAEAYDMEEDDASKYRSVMCVPIRIGLENNVWGVLAVTSNRVGRFSKQRNLGNSSAEDAARSLAKALELLASYTHLWDKMASKEV
ncbi:MAG: GAF domain-containing protein [Pseudomonadota bacterium]